VGEKDLFGSPGSKFVVEFERRLEEYRKSRGDIESIASTFKKKSEKLDKEDSQYALEYLIEAYAELTRKYISAVEDLPGHIGRIFEESIRDLFYGSPEEE
jgi:hypothetical protein